MSEGYQAGFATAWGCGTPWVPRPRSLQPPHLCSPAFQGALGREQPSPEPVLCTGTSRPASGLTWPPADHLIPDLTSPDALTRPLKLCKTRVQGPLSPGLLLGFSEVAWVKGYVEALFLSSHSGPVSPGGGKSHLPKEEVEAQRR